MKRFEILEHTADLKIKVFGKTLIDIFINAALAIAEEQKTKDKKIEKDSKWEKINIQSQDTSSLLIDWLNEILSLGDINNKIYTEFQINKLSENHIEGQIKGAAVEGKKTDIKAATYHDLEIKKMKNHLETTILFDI